MRTLKALLLTLLLSSCTHTQTKDVVDVVSISGEMKPETTDIETCPGYIKGNEYTHCKERFYVVHQNDSSLFEEESSEQEEEAEE